MPNWNTISISGYHIREAGSTAVQEIAFTLANGIAYVEAAIAAGLDSTTSRRGSRSSSTPTTTSSKRWPSTARPGVCGPASCAIASAPRTPSKMLRFHTQTGGSTLTAQQPENNIVRVTVQSAGGRLGRHAEPAHQRLRRGARAAHRAGRPRLALRTQQIIGFESGIADTVDPLAGSYFVESLTDEVEQLAREYISAIDELGGAVAAIEAQLHARRDRAAAYEFARHVDAARRSSSG
jgi:methylmalonyl-CoA mutase N-terminal domain/subunit